MLYLFFVFIHFHLYCTGLYSCDQTEHVFHFLNRLLVQTELMHKLAECTPNRWIDKDRSVKIAIGFQQLCSVNPYTCVRFSNI